MQDVLSTWHEDVFTAICADALSYSLAGNLTSLRNKKIVPKPIKSYSAHWAVVKFVEVMLVSPQTVIYKLQVINGPMAGVYFMKDFPPRALKRLKWDLGFTWKREECVWSLYAEEFVGMFLAVKLEVAQSLVEVDFREYAPKLGLIKHNRELMEARKSPCPKLRDEPCYLCDASITECPFSCRGSAISIVEPIKFELLGDTDEQEPENSGD